MQEQTVFSSDPKALKNMLYNDDFTLASPLGSANRNNHFTKPTLNFKIKLKYMISPGLIKLPVYCQTDFNCIIVYGHIHFCHVPYLFHW